MSYILDALKKSDQERQQNNGPGLQTIQRPHRLDKRRFGFLPVIITSFCCCLLFAASFWFYFYYQDPRLATVPTATIAATTIGPATIDPATETTALDTTTIDVPSSASAAEKNPSDSVAVIKPSTATTATPTPVVEFWQLPDPVQKAIPPLTFSFHVYSDNPERRTIIINKRRVKEGDTIESDLVLEEISQQGVVLQWQGQRFYINVVENW
jgi:general secretion pathway protein B